MTGHTETGNPAKAKANAKAKDSGPEFEVLTVNGKTIREPGKPPWAGGPKVVGPSHPGYAGWSKNHGNGRERARSPRRSRRRRDRTSRAARPATPLPAGAGAAPQVSELTCAGAGTSTSLRAKTPRKRTPHRNSATPSPL